MTCNTEENGKDTPCHCGSIFLSVILITAIVQNPVFMATALVCSALFAFMINRRLAVRTLIAATPVIVVAVLINMLFQMRALPHCSDCRAAIT